uniref:Uncharacterized protein n=1 Tax=Anguilla anguilla TaxID=7936 RepID=A0A0E9SV55_ANGAN
MRLHLYHYLKQTSAFYFTFFLETLRCNLIPYDCGLGEVVNFGHEQTHIDEREGGVKEC